MKRRTTAFLFSPLLAILVLMIAASDQDVSSNSYQKSGDVDTTITSKTGEQLYLDACAACHGVMGQGVTPKSTGICYTRSRFHQL